MPNMSYCRFENTVDDLADCMDNINAEDLSRSECKARVQLIEMCQSIADMYSDEDVKVLIQSYKAMPK